MNTTTPQNILWVTTDHMRYDCIQALGNPLMQTPNLDRLVRHGVSFSNCYCNNPICMPSRASFMTGCYPQATGVNTNGQELPFDFEPVLPKEMNAAGYRTIQVGKLHFQCHEDMDLDPRARHDYGFQVFQISEEPGCYEDAYRTWLRLTYPDQVERFSLPRPGTETRQGEFKNFSVLDAPWECSHSGWVAEQACRHLNSFKVQDTPQFMHLGFYAPHPPLNPTREMFEPYAERELPPPLRREGDPRDPGRLDDPTLVEYKRHFYAMVTGIDLAMGKILKTLEANQQLEDTLIIFSSDHGDACGDHGRVAKGPTYLEGIIQLPLVFHWPNGLGTEAREEKGLFEMVDLLPTLCELAGKSPHPGMQGRSVAGPLLEGQPIEGREDIYCFHGRGDICLRNQRWKYNAALYEDPVTEWLFDLEADPNEFQNLADSPEHRKTLETMRFRALQRSTLASLSPRLRRLRF